LISRDNRPKQFCSIFGGATLLAQTRARIRPAFSQERTVFTVVKAHELYYAPELRDVPLSRVVVQPDNRGTTAAILVTLLRILRFEQDAVVTFFPADHHFSNEASLLDAVDTAAGAIRLYPDSFILLGATPQYPETEYGWIEPGADVSSSRSSLFRVHRFWEKPAHQAANLLMDRGCLWNTFVMVGRARAFLNAIALAVPDVRSTLDQAGAHSADSLFDTLVPGDFSRQVLSACTEKMLVLRLNGTEWSDLGTPERVFAMLKRKGVPLGIPNLVRARSL
jgi:mannose-1-phosphate guanylyltransferase